MSIDVPGNVWAEPNPRRPFCTLRLPTTGESATNTLTQSRGGNHGGDEEEVGEGMGPRGAREP